MLPLIPTETMIARKLAITVKTRIHESAALLVLYVCAIITDANNTTDSKISYQYIQ